MLSREELIEAIVGVFIARGLLSHPAIAADVVNKLEELNIFPFRLSEEEIEARAEAVAEGFEMPDNQFFATAGAREALRNLSKPIPPVKSWEVAAAVAAREYESGAVYSPLRMIAALKAARPLMPEGDE